MTESAERVHLAALRALRAAGLAPVVVGVERNEDVRRADPGADPGAVDPGPANWTQPRLEQAAESPGTAAGKVA